MMSSSEKNDLLYLCSLIEYIGRVTKNRRGDVVKKIGIDNLRHLYDVASVNHCLTFEQVGDEVINDYNITNGTFDTISNCKEKVPSFISIAGDYKRLIMNVNNGDIIETLYNVFTSFISDEISNFDSDLYYQNDSYLMECYKAGYILD